VLGSIFPNPWKLIRKGNDLNAIQIDLILAASLLLFMTIFRLFVILEHINTAISEWKSTTFLYTISIHAILHGFDALLLPLSITMSIFVLREYFAADDIVVVLKFYHLIL